MAAGELDAQLGHRRGQPGDEIRGLQQRLPGADSPWSLELVAHWADRLHELLGRVSNRIINEVRGIKRVVYDISGKPPATIEWE